MSFFNARILAIPVIIAAALAVSSAGFAQSVVSSKARKATSTATQLQGALSAATPMQRILRQKPSLLSATQMPVFGAVAAAPKVASGSIGESPQLAGPAPGVAPELSRDNYGAGQQNSIYHYSDRLVQNALTLYPWRATGFFLFKQSGNWYYCSGSLISRSILLVAGHCVHNGNNSGTGWDTEGYYYPASKGMNGGTPVTPYGVSSAYTFYTWTAWYQTGALDQGYDVGLVILNTRNGDSNPAWEMGRFTGYLGFCTGSCLQTYWSLTQIGYPSNYYGGNNLTEGHHLYASDSRDYIWGSGMQGGSSGGPHVANLGYLSDSSSNQGQWPYRNVVFAPTSWGYTDPQYKIQGGSALTGPNNTFDFVHNLFNPACNVSRSIHGAASCSLF